MIEAYFPILATQDYFRVPQVIEYFRIIKKIFMGSL